YEAERLEFESYAVRLSPGEERRDLDTAEYAATLELLDDDSDHARAQLQWRLSLPLMVFILTLLAMPLSRVNPRQGRFAKLLPAIFLHVCYLSLLLAALDAIGRGTLPAVIGMWPIHLLFLLLGLGLLMHNQRRGMR
ncbi:MAG: LptF/LptG family permease, partial [Halomonadaceae bacterium]|nr:LptF/LptG family permease [Halomonadaceae bacterium]